MNMIAAVARPRMLIPRWVFGLAFLAASGAVAAVVADGLAPSFLSSSTFDDY